MKTIIYYISKRKERLTLYKLIRFLLSNIFRRKILVIDRYGHRPRISKYTKIVLPYLKRLRIIKLISIRHGIDFYSENDFAVVRWANDVARTYAPLIIRAIHQKNHANFKEYDYWECDVEKGLELLISDKLYANLRHIQHVLARCGVKQQDKWGDYQGKLFNSVENTDFWFTNEDQAMPVYLKIDDKFEYSAGIIVNYLNRGHSEEPFNNLILSTTSSSAYIESSIDIANAEAKNNKSTAIFYATSPLKNQTFLRYEQEIAPPCFHPNLENSYHDRINTLIDAKLETCSRQPHDHSEIAIRNIPAFEGTHPQILNPIVGATLVTATNFLPRIMLTYFSIQHDKKFSRIETCICSPSRSPYFVPIIELLRRDGTRIIEYQPFFWSSHPRYIVRNVDMFICSDKATEQIIKNKYQEMQLSVPIIMGPAFPLERFKQRYIQTPKPAQHSMVGIALQPQELDKFLLVCANLNAKGFDLLIRPHPSLLKKNSRVIQQFAPYGRIDMEGSLERFVASSSVVVTGFSNVALQAAYVGKPAVCFMSSESLGLDLSLTHELITTCPDIENIASVVQSLVLSEHHAIKETIPAEEQWINLRKNRKSSIKTTH